MTHPAQPDTGTAGAAPDTGTAPDPEAPETTVPDTGEDTDWKAEAEKNKALARKHEQRAKANKKALDEALAKGKPAEGEPTIEELQQRAADSDARAEAAEVRAVELAYKDAVRDAATEVGADASALLDSQAFRDAVAGELDEDFDDDDLKAAVAKHAAEFAKKPRFAAGTAPPRGGADMTGGAPPPARQRPSSLHGAIKGALGG